MKKINSILTKSFHSVNLILIVFYLYPGSIFGYVLYKDPSVQPHITSDFLISYNHCYAFIILSTIGILAYRETKKINYLIKYLFGLSFLL